MAQTVCLNTTEQDREDTKNACINEEVFTNRTDREFYCTNLIKENNWKIPKDYPIRL